MDFLSFLINMSESDEGRLIEICLTHNSGVVLDRSGEPVVGSSWYLLSTQWYRKWQLYQGLIDHTGEETDPPGPIDNSDILLPQGEYYSLGSNNPCDTVLNPGLVCDVDYLPLPPSAWNVLSTNYGVKTGSVVTRYSIQQTTSTTFIEVNLREIKLAVVMPEYSLVPPTKAIYVSRKLKVGGLYRQVSEVIRVHFNSTRGVSLWEFDKKSSWTDLTESISRRKPGELVEFPGGRLTVMDEDMDDLEVASGDVLVAEVQGLGEKWSFSRLSKRWKCELCRKKFFTGGIQCRCKMVLLT